MSDRSSRFAEAARRAGFPADTRLVMGGNYVPAVVQGMEVHVSGQVPRVGTDLVVAGRVGLDVSLPDARRAAAVCALRVLAILRETLGDLDRVESLGRVGVYVQCAQGFTQLSEVSDAASEVFQFVLGAGGQHARTTVGVLQLPKDAPVEIEASASWKGAAG